MKKILVLAIMAAFLAPVTAGAYEVIVPYFVDDAGVVEGGAWTTIVQLVNNSSDDLSCAIQYTGAKGLNATPAGNSFPLLANSGWAFRPCAENPAQEGNKVSPDTTLASGAAGIGPRPPLTVTDTEDPVDGYPDEEGDPTTFQNAKGSLKISVAAGLDGGWDFDVDGPPISAIIQTYTSAAEYSDAIGMGQTGAVQGGTEIP